MANCHADTPKSPKELRKGGEISNSLKVKIQIPIFKYVGGNRVDRLRLDLSTSSGAAKVQTHRFFIENAQQPARPRAGRKAIALIPAFYVPAAALSASLKLYPCFADIMDKELD